MFQKKKEPLKGKNIKIPISRPKTTFISKRKPLMNQNLQIKTPIQKFDPPNLEKKNQLPPFKLANFIKSSKLFEYIQKADREDYNLQNEDDTTVEVYIREYVFQKMKEAAERKIKKVILDYFHRKKWRGLMHHRIWSRRDIILRIFIGWRGYASKKFETVLNCYERFENLHKEKPWLSKKSNLSPFNLFYLSGRYYYPSIFNSKTFFIVIRLFSRNEGRHLFSLWRMMTSSIKGYREKSISFTFTIRKRQTFGFIFFAFILWYRYTKWKKLSKNKNECFQLEVSEFLIDWRVKENNLNQKKARKMRADTHSIQRVKKKALNSLYHLYIDQLRLQSEMESSKQFYLRRLMNQTQKGWLKFIEIRQKKKFDILKLRKAWYTLAYRDSLTKFSFKVLKEHVEFGLKSKILFYWKKSAREEKLISLLFGIKLQQSSSIPYMILFLLQNKFEHFFFIQIWKKWLQYTKRRKLFKKFLLFNFNNDLIQKKNYLNILKNNEIINFKKLKLKFQLNSLLNYNDYKFENIFITSLNNNYSNDLLFLIFQFYLNKIKIPLNFLNEIKIIKNNNINLLEFNKIIQLFNSTSNEYRKILKFKLYRDNYKIFNFNSRNTAIQFNKKFSNFSISKEEINNKNLFPLINLNKNIIFYPELKDSINYLIELNKKSNYIYSKYLKERYLINKSKLHSRLRHPNEISKLTQYFPIEEQRKKSQQDVIPRIIPSNKVAKHQISSYQKPIISISIDNNSKQLPLNRMVSIADYQINYGIKSMIKKIEIFENINEMIQSIKRFFFSFINLRFDSIRPLEYNNNIIDQIECNLEQKRLIRRNISAFLAEICELDTTNSVPIFVNAPKWGYNSISTILTFHKELKKTNHFNYCYQIPFFKKIDLNSNELIHIRAQIMNKIINKYPKFSKRDQLSINFRRETDSLDEFNISDADLTIFLLPHIFSFEMVGDFLKEEIKIDVNKN